jgi:hypothetical protein
MEALAGDVEFAANVLHLVGNILLELLFRVIIGNAEGKPFGYCLFVYDVAEGLLET